MAGTLTQRPATRRRRLPTERPCAHRDSRTSPLCPRAIPHDLAVMVSNDWIVIALWVAGGIIVISSLFSARLIVRPGRAHVWSSPKDVGLAYEDISFAAQDGVKLVGWFLPAPAHVPR